MRKLEQAFQSEFNRWLKYNFNETAAFELKVTEGSSVPFEAVKIHQLQNLKNVKHRKTIYKIPDDSAQQKPFDCFCIAKEKAYVVIRFLRSDRSKGFYMIDIDDFDREAVTSTRKSLTEDRAGEIGVFHILGQTIFAESVI